MPTKKSKNKKTLKSLAESFLVNCILCSGSPERYIKTFEEVCAFMNLSITTHQFESNGKPQMKYEGKDSSRVQEFMAAAKKCHPLGEHELEVRMLEQCIRNFHKPKTTSLQGLSNFFTESCSKFFRNPFYSSKTN